MVQLIPFTENDIIALTGLQPEGWLDIIPTHHFYLQSDFCYPFKLIQSEKIIGIGTYILHRESAWLAHIIVDKQEQKKGYGEAITRWLIQQINPDKIPTISLLATDMGEPVYTKIGFKVDSEYAFFKDGNFKPTANLSPIILPFQASYTEALLQLDRECSGEVRTKLLQQNFTEASVYIRQGIMEGFYLPSLGEGLLIASTEEAGLALMNLRLLNASNACLPISCKAGMDLLSLHHFNHFRTAKRMYLGKKLDWNPKLLYNRIAGNLG